MNIRLIPVSEGDRPFLFALRKATMQDYIERTWGWDESWQKKDFDAHFDPEVQKIIFLDDAPVGFVHVERRPGELFIVNFQVAPDFQGRGIGTAVIQRIVEDAREARLSVGLAVLQVNQRALRLYQRLGFRIVSEELPFLYLRIGPGS